MAIEWVDNGRGWLAVLLVSADEVLAVRCGPTDPKFGVVGPYPSGSPAAIDVRAFFPEAGVACEDPVAGSLNASVAMWLLTIGRLTAPYIAAQGTALGRRGRVYVEEDSDGTGWIGGTTTTCTSGTVGLRPYTECYTDCMTSVQIPTRFRDDELADLDSLVADGVAESRSQVIRLAVERLFDAHRRRTIGEQIAAAYRTVPQTDDEHAWAVANAIALTEAEPW